MCIRDRLRVDANGAFSPEEAPARLRELSAFGIHSIEQPIRPRQWEDVYKRQSFVCSSAVFLPTTVWLV